MRIISRAEWGASPPVRALQADQLPWTRLWLHHAVTAMGGAAVMRQIQQEHQRRGWRDIAYNIAVGSDGIYEGIGIGNRHLNSDAGGSGTILLIGNFDTQPVPPEMIERTAWLVAHGLLSGWWSTGITGGHRDIPGAKPTACPGRFAHAAIPKINAEAERIIHALQGDEGEHDMPWIIRTTDPEGRQRNAITDGIYRREFVSVGAMRRAHEAGAKVVVLPWDEWTRQYPPAPGSVSLDALRDSVAAALAGVPDGSPALIAEAVVDLLAARLGDG